MVAVSIIIINYNTLELTLECIDSIYKHCYGLEFEIIVVDNDSKICPFIPINDRFKDVIIIKSRINLGFGKANNLGSEYAKGKYIFFLNSDTILINNAIKIMYDFIENQNDDKIAALGGNLYTANNKPNYSYSLYYPSIWRIILYRFRFNKIFTEEFFNYTTAPKKVKIIIGADLFIRAKIFNDIGRFDPFYFMYIEDGDLQFQLNKNKYSVYNIPDAKIIHLQGASSSTSEKMIMEIDSYYYFFKKNSNKLVSILYLFIEFFFAIFYFLFFLIINIKTKKENYKKLIIHIFNAYIFTKVNK